LRPTFRPLVSNPHLLTIAGNFWPRKIDQKRFPALRREYRIDENNAVVAIEHQPEGKACGQLVFLHGLEGSADAGYITSLSQAALERGWGVHRLNMRTCGGTEQLSETMYHSGLTSDPLFVLHRLFADHGGPLFLVGFSLGGNVTLKLAGEVGDAEFLAGCVAISAPIDLAAAVRAVDKGSNFFYSRRFVSRLRDRVRRKAACQPDLYSEKGLESVKTVWEFDDRVTAPLFGFGSAANYYATQSAINFLPHIRIPTLVVVAKDDPLVPFETYNAPVFKSNSALELVVTEKGGHLGFIARGKPRFWLDNVVVGWVEEQLCSRDDIRANAMGS
jgi:predicted alpha/beta-fold hydrolase